jgi:hypothetical protein
MQWEWEELYLARILETWENKAWYYLGSKIGTTEQEHVRILSLRPNISMNG